MTGTAEDKRQVLPDPSHPSIINGTFEEAAKGEEGPRGWHYLRHGELTRGIRKGSKHSRSRMIFQAVGARPCKPFPLTVARWTNSTFRPGCGSRIRNPARAPTNYRCWPSRFTTRSVRWSDSADSVPGAERQIGSARGRIRVPTNAREAIVRIGLLGGVGEVAFDDVQIRGAPKGEKP